MLLSTLYSSYRSHDKNTMVQHWSGSPEKRPTFHILLTTTLSVNVVSPRKSDLTKLIPGRPVGTLYSQEHNVIYRQTSLPQWTPFS